MRRLPVLIVVFCAVVAGVLVVSAAVETGLLGMVRYEGASDSLIRAAHPEVVIGPGQVQAWVVGSGIGRGLASQVSSVLAERLPMPEPLALPTPWPFALPTPVPLALPTPEPGPELLAGVAAGVEVAGSDVNGVGSGGSGFAIMPAIN